MNTSKCNNSTCSNCPCHRHNGFSNFETWQVNNIINNVFSLCKSELKGKEIQIHKKGLDKEKIITADPIQIREILLNLISNSIKFTEEGKIGIIFNKISRNYAIK